MKSIFQVIGRLSWQIYLLGFAGTCFALVFEAAISTGAGHTTTGFSLFAFLRASTVVGLLSFPGFFLSPWILYLSLNLYISDLWNAGDWVCFGGGAGNGLRGAVGDQVFIENAAMPGAFFAITLLAMYLTNRNWRTLGVSKLPLVAASLMSIVAIALNTHAYVVAGALQTNGHCG